MLSLNIDIKDLLSLEAHFEEAVKKVMSEAGQRLAMATHAHVIEQAGKLEKRQRLFLEGLKFIQENENTFIIHLDASVAWVEDGVKPQDPKPPKFEGEKNGNTRTPAATDLLASIKQMLVRQKIPLGKIETDKGGRPLTGLLHQVKVPPPQKMGPVQQVRIYQTEQKDKQGKPWTRRDIVTFKATQKQKFNHPGFQGANLFSSAEEWAFREWDQKIVPEILEALNREL